MVIFWIPIPVFAAPQRVWISKGRDSSPISPPCLVERNTAKEVKEDREKVLCTQRQSVAIRGKKRKITSLESPWSDSKKTAISLGLIPGSRRGFLDWISTYCSQTKRVPRLRGACDVPKSHSYHVCVGGEGSDFQAPGTSEDVPGWGIGVSGAGWD